MGNVIFDDLLIDHSTMMSDPEKFCSSVYEAAEVLKDILKQTNSVDTYIKTLPKNEHNYADLDDLLSNIYDIADEMPIQAIPELVKKVKQLAADLENLQRDRAIYELAAKMNVMDKNTAHVQYSRLREAFNQYVEAMEVLDIYSGTKLPSMPGNYGTTVSLKRTEYLNNYVFLFPDQDEGYRNHIAVCKKIGVDHMNLMDTLDYIKEHPELKITVQIVEK